MYSSLNSGKYRTDLGPTQVFLLPVFAVWEVLLLQLCLHCWQLCSTRGRTCGRAEQISFESVLFQMLDVLIRGQQNNSSFFQVRSIVLNIFLSLQGIEQNFPVPPSVFLAALSVRNNNAHMKTFACIKKYRVFIVKLASLKLGMGDCRLIRERASLRLNHKWSAQYVEKHKPKEYFTANLFFAQPNSYLTYMSICIYGFVCCTPAAAATFFCLQKMLKNQSCFIQK